MSKIYILCYADSDPKQYDAFDEVEICAFHKEEDAKSEVLKLKTVLNNLYSFKQEFLQLKKQWEKANPIPVLPQKPKRHLIKEKDILPRDFDANYIIPWQKEYYAKKKELQERQVRYDNYFKDEVFDMSNAFINDKKIDRAMFDIVEDKKYKSTDVIYNLFACYGWDRNREFIIKSIEVY